jgi:hypothetical protein
MTSINKEQTLTIRPMTDEERNRAKEKANVNRYNPLSNFPKESLEARVEAIEEFMKVLLEEKEKK